MRRNQPVERMAVGGTGLPVRLSLVRAPLPSIVSFYMPSVDSVGLIRI